MRHIRYRDFITYLQSATTEDDGTRIIKSQQIDETRNAWLSLMPGRNGGIAIITTTRGLTPAGAGVSVELDPTTTCSALADALATDAMMALARLILTPGAVDANRVIEFGDGLQGLSTNPFPSDSGEPGATKPPSLDAALWRRIPHEQRHDFIVPMARGADPRNTSRRHRSRASCRWMTSRVYP